MTFINCFEVPAEREEEFLGYYQQVNEYLRARPGFISNRLHRRIQPGAHFAFINVVRWESAEAWQAAHDDGFRELVSRTLGTDFPATGALFEVVAEN